MPERYHPSIGHRQRSAVPSHTNTAAEGTRPHPPPPPAMKVLIPGSLTLVYDADKDQEPTSFEPYEEGTSLSTLIGRTTELGFERWVRWCERQRGERQRAFNYLMLLFPFRRSPPRRANAVMTAEHVSWDDDTGPLLTTPQPATVDGGEVTGQSARSYARNGRTWTGYLLSVIHMLTFGLLGSRR